MIHWKETVNVGDLHTARREGKMSVAETATALAKRLSRITRYKENIEFQNIIEQFEELGNDENTSVQEYDEVLYALYEFGDYDHQLWINALYSPPSTE